MVAYHQSVMLSACVDWLDIRPDGVYVDATFGGGGHSRAILERLNENGRLFGFDQDVDAQANCPNDRRFELIPNNFRFLNLELRRRGFNKVNGILADFGVSSHQFDEAERGFSYRFDAPLDMRMNAYADLNAALVLNNFSFAELAKTFRVYGEVENAGKLAKAIVIQRESRRFKTTEDLNRCAAESLHNGGEYKVLSQIYQALRIVVNDEMQALDEFLLQTVGCLQKGGRLVALSYHSLEDRLVKHYMQTGNAEGDLKRDFYGASLSPFKQLTRKPLQPDEQEISQNPRARSAKLRAAEKL